MADPTPDTARRYVKTLADLYAEATTALLRQIADRMARGLDDTAQRAKLADVLALREQARQVAAQVSDALDTSLAATIGQAYDHGAAQGADHLSRLLGLRDADADRRALSGLTGTKRSTVEALSRGLGDQLRDLPMIRATEDAYRQATLAAVVPSAAGVETRRQATQTALDRLAMSGLTGFRDRSGRNWRLETYADMATRTTVGQAALQGTVDRIRQTTPFVRVSDVADECELCRPWEGEVLLTTDPDEVPHEWRDVKYAATLREAVGRGLFHPNCTHSLGAFIPGLTRDNAARPANANPQGYADRQRQRALERHVRDWRRREAVAIDPHAARKAAAKRAAWEQRLTEHVTATNRLRRRDRETLPGRVRDLPAAVDPRDLPTATPAPRRDLARDFPVDAPPTPTPASVVTAVEDMSDAALEDHVADLMAAGNFGADFDRASDELDRRDAARNAAPSVPVPDAPDPRAEQEALERLLYGGRTAAQMSADRDRDRAEQARRDPEKEVRDEYDTWVYTQWLRAEEECRGRLLSREAMSNGVDPLDLFTRRLSLKHASSELQEWFAQPGNERLSFPEFRAGVRDDKRARDADRRRRNRGFESEYG